MSKATRPAFPAAPLSPFIEQGIAVQRLSRDLATAAARLSENEARFLVDYYYICQDDRMRFLGQVRAMTQSQESTMVLDWLGAQAEVMEGQVKRALDKYTDAHPIGTWIKSLYGFGPVLAAGIIAHIDIEKAPTAGHIWSYAGLVDGKEWISSADAARWVKENGLDVELAARTFNRNPANLRAMASQDREGEDIEMTAKSLAAAIARRPWNAALKKLCFKIGECMVKFAGNEQCFYGHVFRDRRLYEWENNLNGVLAQKAANDGDKYSTSTESYAWVKGMYHPDDIRALRKKLDTEGAIPPDELKKIRRKAGEGVPMLPPAQIHARARRYAVKLFLSHLHTVWYETHFQRRPPNPFVIEHMGHVHYIQVPNYESPYVGQMPSAVFQVRRNRTQ